MTPRLEWSATPNGLRTAAELATKLDPKSGPSRVALLAGAGMDSALTKRPGWQGLITALAGTALPHATRRGLASAAGHWPVETAQALHQTIGRDLYRAAVSREASERKLEIDSPMADALALLCSRGLQVIATFNYSDDISRCLTALADAGKGGLAGKHVITIDLGHLSTWRPSDLLNPPEGSIHILKLHGSPSSGVVLDRASYDAVERDNFHYREVLLRLFEDYTVLSVGVSWTDVPLRNAAAEARRQFPHAPSFHFALLPAEERAEVAWWTQRSLIASYDVRALYYAVGKHPVPDHSDASRLLCRMAQEPALNAFNGEAALVEIANRLDGVGDFQSSVQFEWLDKYGSRIKQRILSTSATSAIEWQVLARIERHLRHYLWFSYGPGGKGTNGASREEIRQELWEHIAGLFVQMDVDSQRIAWDSDEIVGVKSPTAGPMAPRGLFEFALGVLEVAPNNPAQRRDWDSKHSTWHLRLKGLSKGNRTLKLRTQIGLDIWSATPTLKTLERARRRSVEAAWGSIEAKIALDICELEFRKTAGSLAKGYRTTEIGPSRQMELLDLAYDARDVARIAGSTRREIGALTMAALVAPILESEGMLVGLLRRISRAGGKPDFASLWSIYIALLALRFDQTPEGKAITAADALRWLSSRVSEVALPLNHALVRENYCVHWRKFHAPGADLAARVALLL